MLKLSMNLKRLTAVAIGAAILMGSFSHISYAEQPRWEKSHGHYNKHHRKHFRKFHRRPARKVYVERHDHYYGNGGSNQGSWLNAQSGGTILGAIVGAAAGTQFGKGKGRVVAILGGAVLGGVLGGEVGRSMQEADRAQTQYALETTPTGQSASWQNPDTGSSYKVVPTRTFKSEDNQDCRDFSTWAVVDGYEEEVHGTVCRQSDGTWRQMKI